MKKKVISSLVVACTCVLAVGVSQINAVPASAAGISYSNPDSLIQMVGGASIRVSDENTSGIRFSAQIDKAKYDALETANGAANVSAGIIIVPSDYLDSVTAFTHEALAAKYTEYSYKETSTFVLSEDETSYQFALSLVDIHDYNYARDFCATAYVKVDKGETEEYTYASFNQEADERSIYEVAYAAYNDRSATKEGEYQTEIDGKYSKLSAEGLNAAKAYMDKIAAVTKNGDTVENTNTDYYTSPYELIGSGNSYVLDGKGAAPVSVVYNGEVATEGYVQDGDLQIATVQNQKTTWNENGSVTLAGIYSTNANAGTFNDVSVKNYIGYYGLKGSYGVGNYVDVTFTGNNMPYVMFFADTIDGNLSNAGGTGMVVVNGIVSSSTESWQNYNNKLHVFGPNRISGINAEAMLIEYDAKKTAYPGLTEFTQSALKDGIEYRYIVGTSLASDNTITLEMYLYDLTNSREAGKVIANTGATEADLPAGNIVLYGAAKGLEAGSETKAEASTFTINSIGKDLNLPTTLVKTSGATFNDDGSVTLQGYVAANANVGNLVNVNNSYVAFDAQYGFGTTVEVEFVGNNMPYIMFFAEEINGNMTNRNDRNGDTNYDNDGVSGVLFINGMVTNDSDTTYHTKKDSWKGFASNRINYNLGGSTAPTGTENLTQAYLAAHSTTRFNFKLTITQNAARTSIFYKAVLTDLDNNVTVVDYNAETDGTNIGAISTLRNNLGFAAGENPTGKIVLYANMKGATDTVTTFKYKTPYVA